MFYLNQKFDNLINLTREKTTDFVYSYFFPTLVALISLLFWIADLQLIGLTIVTLTTCFVFVVYDDFLPIIPLMLMIPMCFRDPSTAISSTIVPIIVIFSLLVLAIIFHLIKYSITIKFDKYSFMLICIVGLFIFSGIFAINFNNYLKAFDLFIISAIAPLAIHLFFYSKVKLNEKINYRRYFCFSFICAITLASMQLCYVFTYIKLIGPWPLGEMPGGFTWSNSNHVANLVLIAVPLCCYMMASTKRIWAWFIELLFLYLTLLLSSSDGGLATLVIFTPFIMYFLYQNAYISNRKFLRYAYFIIISIAILIVAILCLFLFDELLEFILSSSSSNGRNFLYSAALECFKERPIFGVGFGNGKACVENIIEVPDARGFFHSTFFHVLACAGMVGIIVYLIYYIVRIKYLIKGDSLLGKFSLISLLMFAIYALIENSEFNIVLMFMTTIITFVGLTNKKGSVDTPLPLYVKNPKF